MGFDDAKPSTGGQISQGVVANIVSDGGSRVVATHYYPDAAVSSRFPFFRRT